MFYGAAIADNVVLKQKQLRASYHRVRKQDNSALMQRINRRVYEDRLGTFRPQPFRPQPFGPVKCQA